MTRSIRLTVLACAAALALSMAAAAAGSYRPSMGIFHATYKPGGAGALAVVVAQERADDPTARIVIYVAPGYTVTLGQAAGSTIGNVVAEVQVLDLGSTKPVTLKGPVQVDNPASHVADACAPGMHAAVWTLNAAVPGQPANPIPVYVDHTAGAEAALGPAKLTVCFRNPTLPQNDPRRSPSGTKFLNAAFRVKGVFRNPSTAGMRIWRSIFTPYPVGSPFANASGTREAQAVVPMPYSLSLKPVRARRGFFRVAGALNINGQRPSGVRVGLFARVRTSNGLQFKQVASARTRRGGTYAFTRRRPRGGTVVFAQRLPAQLACLPTPLPFPCTAAIESNALSRSLKIAPARRRR